MPLSLEQNDELCEIRLEGAVNIACAQELKRLLLDALASGLDTRVALDGVTEFDACALQLLIAASRKWRQDGRRLAIAGCGAGAVAESIARAGIERLELEAVAETLNEE